MQIEKTNRIVVAVYLALTVLNVAGFIQFDLLRDRQYELTERRQRAMAEANRLLAGSKSLTGSVRAFAATGDPAYEKAYWDEVEVLRSRDRAESALRGMGLNDGEVELIERAKRASDELIRIEEQAFKAGRAREREKAVELVFGDAYRKALRDIHTPIDQFRKRVDRRMEREVAEAERLVQLGWNIGLALALLNALLIVGILGVLYRRRVIAPLARMNQQVQDMLAGRESADCTVSFSGAATEIDELARSFSVYRQTARQAADEQWVKAHQARIAGELQGAEDVAELARRFLAEVAPLIEVGHGVYFSNDQEARRLQLTAHYAYNQRKQLANRFAHGEGLVGQCALEREPILISRPPEDYVRIGSGLGDGVPVAILALPVINGGRLLGVVEVASFRPFTEREQALLDGLLPFLAMNLEIIERNARTRRLLEESREQAQHMEHQAHQLAQQTDELDAQKRSITALLEEQNAIFEAVTSGVAVVFDGVVQKGNRQLETLFGVAAGAIAGSVTRQWYPDAASYAEVERCDEALAAGETVRVEVPMVRSGGEPFWGRLSGRAIDVRDTTRGVVWTLEDISDERAAAEAMRRAKELAEDAARVKSDFLANMSHEIRTPMNAIIGLAHLVLKSELTPHQRDYLRKIHQSGQHLLGIINDILDFSKIEAGKLDIERTPFELDRVLGNVADLIGEKVAAKGLELLFDVAAEVPHTLLGDPLRLGQILINYANNAVKFTERGEIAIRVRVREECDGEVLLHFGVRDTGPGLSEAQRERLFQSFNQADTSTTRKYGGTGLGLAISKNLAELMGGEVGVESVPGEGSTFWFTARLGVAAEQRRRMLPAGSVLRGQRVLVVDDNESARAVLADMLGTMGFVVDAVEDGGAAVRETRRAAERHRPYDMLFLDWQMPGMDGSETAEAIRRLHLQPTPRMLMVTAYGREEVLRSAEAAGIDDILIKPVSASTLFESVIRSGGSGSERSEAGPEGVPFDLAPLAGARLLLVEDNDLNREVAIGLLADAEVEVEVAENGQLAVDMVQEHDYDAVLMDMQMPVMDGVTATVEIRRLPGLAELPIIAMTANAMPRDRELCAKAGMNDHVAKPIDPDEMWAALLRWVRPRTPAAAPLPAPASPPAAEEGGDDLPRHIAGLEVAASLKRLGGRHAMYRSLLQRFVAGQRGAPAQIDAALAAGDRATAELLAHTLKGSAGNIGAGEVVAEAARLEAAIKEGVPAERVAEHNAACGARLKALVEALDEWLAAAAGEADEAPSEPVAVAREVLLPAVARLADGLRQNNAAVGGLWQGQAALFRAAFPDEWQGIEEALRGFDFEEALARLEAAAEAHGVAPWAA
ncbi:response regulator [Endothiovibrio diazotrophicus]